MLQEKSLRAMTAVEASLYLTTCPPDEPVFILRGQDQLAVPTVFFWAQLAEKHNLDMKKISGAWAAAESMAAWPKRRMPD